MNCDPDNQDKCLLCRSGFYMTENSVCVKNGEKPKDPVDQTNGGKTDPTDETSKFEFINKVIMMTVLLFVSF